MEKYGKFIDEAVNFCYTIIKKGEYNGRNASPF